jgi:hypothetical protein
MYWRDFSAAAAAAACPLDSRPRRPAGDRSAAASHTARRAGSSTTTAFSSGTAVGAYVASQPHQDRILYSLRSGDGQVTLRSTMNVSSGATYTGLALSGGAPRPHHPLFNSPSLSPPPLPATIPAPFRRMPVIFSPPPSPPLAAPPARAPHRRPPSPPPPVAPPPPQASPPTALAASHTMKQPVPHAILAQLGGPPPVDTLPLPTPPPPPPAAHPPPRPPRPGPPSRAPPPSPTLRPCHRSLVCRGTGGPRGRFPTVTTLVSRSRV